MPALPAWDDPKKAAKKIALKDAESDNRWEQLVGKAALRLWQQHERLVPRVQGGPRPPFTAPTDEAHQLEQWRQVWADPTGETLKQLVAQRGAQSVWNYAKEMMRLEEKMAQKQMKQPSEGRDDALALG